MLRRLCLMLKTVSSEIWYAERYASQGEISAEGEKSIGLAPSRIFRVKQSLKQRKPSDIYSLISILFLRMNGAISGFEKTELKKAPPTFDKAGAQSTLRIILPTAV